MIFTDVQTLKDFLAGRPTLPEMLKESSKKKETHTSWNSGGSQRDGGRETWSLHGKSDELFCPYQLHLFKNMGQFKERS